MTQLIPKGLLLLLKAKVCMNYAAFAPLQLWCYQMGHTSHSHLQLLGCEPMISQTNWSHTSFCSIAALEQQVCICGWFVCLELQLWKSLQEHNCPWIHSFETSQQLYLYDLERGFSIKWNQVSNIHTNWLVLVFHWIQSYVPQVDWSLDFLLELGERVQIIGSSL